MRSKSKLIGNEGQMNLFGWKDEAPRKPAAKPDRSDIQSENGVTGLNPNVNPQLIETSFKDAIALIAAAQELPAEKRAHWASSLRSTAKALGRPLEVIPARYSAVRADLLNLHAVPAGMTAKTLQNHKSNAKSALLWLAKEKGIPEHGAPLLPVWARLKGNMDESLVRYRLSSLMRFCSAGGIRPEAVNEAVIDRLMAYRTTIGKPADNAFRRLLARAWNECAQKIANWPRTRLSVPAPKSRIKIAWVDFPEELRRDVERYLDGLTRMRRSRNGQRIRPLKPSTIHTRCAELQAAARMAVKAGSPIETLTSMAALLSPEITEKVLDAYWQKNGETPAAFSIAGPGRRRPNPRRNAVAVAAIAGCGSATGSIAGGAITDRGRSGFTALRSACRRSMISRTGGGSLSRVDSMVMRSSNGSST